MKLTIILKQSMAVNQVNMENIKIKFNSADNLSLNKILKLHNLTVIVRSVFDEDGKCYP